MQRKPPAIERDELHLIHDQVLAVIEVMGAQLPAGVGEGLIEAAANALKRRNSRGLRQLYRDTSEMVRGLSPRDRKALGALLTSRSLPQDILRDDSERRRAERILERQCIRNEEEFQILEWFVDTRHETAHARASVELANRLLAAFVQDRRPPE